MSLVIEFKVIHSCILIEKAQTKLLCLLFFDSLVRMITRYSILSLDCNQTLS